MPTANTIPPPPDVNPHARRLIEFKAGAFRGRHLGVDPDDVRQELALHALRSASLYDPARGSRSTFYDRVLTVRLAELRRYQSAGRRDRRREALLADAATVSCRRWREPALQLDIAAALADLPPEARALAAAFMAGDRTAAAAARSLRWTRQQVRYRQRQLAQCLSAFGLGRCGSGVGR